jgi:putative SOS response-associated peptidase YedK
MCGRFTLTLDPGELQTLLDLGTFIHLHQPRYNIAPSQPIPIVRDPEKRAVELYQWGLVPSWSKDITFGSRLINARAETAHEKPSFRGAFKYHRCLILADGFFEWHQKENESVKTPFYFKLKDSKPFTFAGLYDHWQSPDGGELHTCTILTCPPNDLVADYHQRMPVILASEKRWDWLSKDFHKAQLRSLLTPYPSEEMICYPVSREINSPKNDHPDLLLPTND